MKGGCPSCCCNVSFSPVFLPCVVWSNNRRRQPVVFVCEFFFLHHKLHFHRHSMVMVRFLIVFVAIAMAVVDSLRLSMSSGDSRLERIGQSEKGNLKSAIALVTSGILVTSLAPPTLAKVYFDTDTYGDKELKIATVNKMKQKLRNAILEDNELGADLLKLAINDALSYDAKTDEGGPDGSIQFELEREENKSLKKAVDVVKKIQKELQRTNTVSYSDLVAFGGAEALETVGCDRVIVQVGRSDAKKEGSADAQVVNWSNMNVATTAAAFTSSGLSSRELVLLLGALGEINRVVEETKAAGKGAEQDEDDCGIDGCDPTAGVPTTFGARDNMYGAKMGKSDFSSKYLAALLKNSKKGGSLDTLSSNILADDQARTFVKKYAENDAAFKKDVTECYLTLTQLGKKGTTRNS